MSTSTSGRGRASRSAANTSDEHQEGEDGALLVPPLGAAGGAAASRVLPLALNNANVFASAAAVADHIATLPPIVLADPPGHAAATMAEASAAKTIDGISISIAAAPDTTTTKKRAARASTARARRPLKKKPPLDVGADAMTPNSKSDKPKRLPYGPAQAKFIMDTRRAIDLGKCPAFENDWSNIKPGCLTSNAPNNHTKDNRTPLRHSVGDYYIKPLAVWVPHLIIPGHVPVCPHCHDTKGVYDEIYGNMPRKPKWIANPKLLWGVHSHKYLDTVMYSCRTCAHRCFLGTHPISMALSNSRVLGQFRFYLPQGNALYAMDEELYRYIATCAQSIVPLVKIEATLKRYHQQTYDQTLMRYLLDAQQGRVIPKLESRFSKKKRKREEYLPSIQNVVDLRLQLKHAERQAEDIAFEELLNLKRDRNKRNLPLPSLGVSKLELLIGVGIETATELVECARFDDDPMWVELQDQCKKPGTAQRWVDAVAAALKDRQDGVIELKTKVQQAEAELGPDMVLVANELQEQQEREKMEVKPAIPEGEPPTTLKVKGDIPTTTTTVTTTTTDTVETNEYEPFSDITDIDGYNARFVIGNAIKDAVQEEFNQQRFVYRDRMTRLGGSALRLYFIHDICKIICRGVNDNPYQCMAVLYNEQGLVIWWAMIPKTLGSIEDYVLGPLKRCKARLDRLGSSVQSFFAEDSVLCEKIQQQVFEVQKFGLFEWLDRWNACFVSPKSNTAEAFRALMCKAVTGISADEFRRAKRVLKSQHALGRMPTLKEIIVECNNAQVPAPEEQISAIMNTMLYFYHHDVRNEILRANKVAGAGAVIFNTYNVVAKIVEDQLKPIRAAGLSVSSYAKGNIEELSKAIQKEVFKNEKHCGIRRAEQGIWTLLDCLNSKVAGEDGLPVDDNHLFRNDGANNNTITAPLSQMQEEGNALASALGLAPPNFQATEPTSTATKHTTTVTNAAETEDLGFDVAWDDSKDDGRDFDEYLESLTNREIHDPEPGVDAINLMTREDVELAVDSLMDMEQQQGPSIAEHIAKAISKHEREMEQFLEDMNMKTGFKPSLRLFRNLSQEEGWCVFLDTTPFDNDSEDPVCVAERTVFRKAKIYVDASYSGTTGDEVMKVWNWEAGHRLKNRCNGDDPHQLTLIRLKTLEHFHDQMEVIKLATSSNADDFDFRLHWRRFCITCGFTKKEHAAAESFAGTCTKGFCARCGILLCWHAQTMTGMGFSCVVTEAQGGMASKIDAFDQKWRIEATQQHPKKFYIAPKNPSRSTRNRQAQETESEDSEEEQESAVV